jgi:hypothetical protein
MEPKYAALPPSVAEICAAIQSISKGGKTGFQWRLPWGAALELEVQAASVPQLAAA